MLSERRLKPGQMVSQRELCEQTDTSIGAMREALKRLEAEAIVSLIPQRGVLVREIDARELGDVYKLRELIEVPAARTFARLGQPDLLAKNREHTREIIGRNPSTAEESALFARERMLLDEDLHFAIVSVFDNPVIIEIYEKVNNQLRLSRMSVTPRFTGTRPAMIEHMAILDAIDAGDEEAAGRAMADHLDKSLQRAVGMN
ncbi:MAG: GntR family transcriptional regulator [Hyphomicrobiales bacterium]|nr:GntR family transcriptional regulator [Hyphomicrobiales bacterium]